jgi:hypothetical protein
MLIPVCVIVRQELMIISDHLCVIPVILVADIRSTIISPTDLYRKPYNLNGKVACFDIFKYNFKKIKYGVGNSFRQLFIFSLSKDCILWGFELLKQEKNPGAVLYKTFDAP